MDLLLADYSAQAAGWPARGRHVLAQSTERSLVVYQAYRPSIADHACRAQAFGGRDFSFSRMSWIKPNFLWMMYRSGWATKPGQERVLAVQIDRAAFERWLGRAVLANGASAAYPSAEARKVAMAGSDVRLQWDPDHGPDGEPLERRALQLGLRGDALREYATDAVRRIEDITEFVRSASGRALPPFTGLRTPLEALYRPDDASIAARIGLD